MAFEPGFVKQEALDLLALSSSIEDVHDPIIPNPPAGWACVFDGPIIGPFDNKWQLWKRAADGAFAIAVRGTVDKPGSIIEDVIALMITASGSLKIGATTIDYTFAADPEAGVHLGFALGALVLLKARDNGILARLNQQGIGAGSKVYVTGHSQGAAVATLIRSYLDHAAEAPTGIDYKTYIFAQPKPGNDHYAADFDHRFSKPYLAYCINNSMDWVPQVPFTLQFIGDIDKPNPISAHIPLPLQLALAATERGVKETRDAQLARNMANFQSLATQLALSVDSNALVTGSHDLSIPIKPSLNYVNAGTLWPLIGRPCSGDECKDGFFEHHATTYYGLLSA